MTKTARFLQRWLFVVCITVFSADLSYAEKGKTLTGEELKQMLSKEGITMQMLLQCGWQAED